MLLGVKTNVTKSWEKLHSCFKLGKFGSSAFRKSLFQEITHSAGHLLQCAHRHPSLPFLRIKKAHLSDSLVSLSSLFDSMAHAHADFYTRDLNFPSSPGNTSTEGCKDQPHLQRSISGSLNFFVLIFSSSGFQPITVGFSP